MSKDDLADLIAYVITLFFVAAVFKMGMDDFIAKNYFWAGCYFFISITLTIGMAVKEGIATYVRVMDLNHEN